MNTKVYPEHPIGLETMAPAVLEAKGYHQWVFSRLASHLGRQILEVGPADGAITELLASRRNVTAVELDATCCKRLRERFVDSSLVTIVQGDFMQEQVQRSLAEQSFGTVVAINVLEHLADDGAALRAFRRLLNAPPYTLALFVPAHPILFGRLDVLAGHHRRYTRQGLVGALETAGFRVIKMQYLNAIGFLGWFLNGRILRPRDLQSRGLDWQVRLFNRVLVPLLAVVESRVRVPFGQSLVAIAVGG